MPFQKGQSGNPAGKPVGVQNRLTRQAREAIELCFQGIGGVPALRRWAKKNPGEFYTKVWTKLLPLQIADSNGQPLKMPQSVVFISGGPQRALEPSRMTITVQKQPEALEAGTNGNGNGAHS